MWLLLQSGIPLGSPMEVTSGEVQTHYWQGSLLSHPQLILTPCSSTHLETKMAHSLTTEGS